MWAEDGKDFLLHASIFGMLHTDCILLISVIQLLKQKKSEKLISQLRINNQHSKNSETL